MHLYPIDGAVHQVDASATAFRFREAGWANVIVGVDPDAANASRIKDWTVSYWEALHATSLGGGYVNFMMDEGEDRVRASYGQNYDRLARIKAKYDPGQLLSHQPEHPAEYVTLTTRRWCRPACVPVSPRDADLARRLWDRVKLC